MKHLFWAAVVSAVTFTACGTDAEVPEVADVTDQLTDTVQPPAGEPAEVSGEMPEKYNDYAATASGLRYKIHRAGTGNKIKLGDKVKVHYHGSFTSGVKFDASYDRGEPFALMAGLDMVIEGWNEGIPMLSEGDSAEFYIPWNLAYGEAGGNGIPAKANLVFIIVAEEIEYATDFDYTAYEKQRTQTGLTYFIVEEGDGAKAPHGSNVSAHYTGAFTNGQTFDSSVGKGTPFSFNVGQGQVIPGWDEVVQLMSVGTKVRAIIPFYLAYGEQGRGSIPPYSTLIFDMELMSIN
jgi:FKBP-type peptidyl-prolyl cis-trans isomerase